MYPSEWLNMHGGTWPGPMPEDGGELGGVDLQHVNPSPAPADIFAALLSRNDVRERLSICGTCDEYQEPRHCEELRRICGGCSGGSILARIANGLGCPREKWKSVQG